ncbi:methyltransferase dimerization domain-containing protein [Streptomyces collinus]|uniref:methyltransferase family protein n=1 Tax=Streptomyces collinus TaxID=42684 RepID=UPI00382570B1
MADRQPAVQDAALLLSLNFGFARARALATAIELGVFTALAPRARAAGELASTLGCSGRGTERLLDALAGMDLLRRDGVAYANTPVSAAYLVAGTRSYLGPHLADVMDQWDRWSELTDVVRSGRSAHDLGVLGRRARNSGMFAQAFPLTFPTAVAVAERAKVPDRGDVLDLAAGGGEWAIATAVRHRETRVVAHDEPELLEICRERVADFGLTERFSFVPADFRRPPFPDASFDLVILAQLGRFVGPLAAERLVRQAARLARPGGCVTVADVMKGDTGAPRAAGSMIDLSLLVNTLDGELLERSAYRSWLAGAGLSSSAEFEEGPVSVLVFERF